MLFSVLALVPQKLGDSFLFGVGYDYPLTFAAIFSDAMARAGVEVLNAGVVSYSPIIHVRKLEHLLTGVGLEVDEVVVFLDISCQYGVSTCTHVSAI